MNPINTATTRPTRQLLQDVCRLMGKLQRLFIGELEHDQQYGLTVTDHGFTTQLFEFGGREWRLTLELPAGNLVAGTQSWPLADNPPAKLQELLQYWLADQGYAGQIGDAQLHGEGRFDQAAAESIWRVMSWGHQQLNMFKSELPADQTASLLLYPHHFDEAFGWFYQPGVQYTVGLAPGDEPIDEPYFYVTHFPHSEAFDRRSLPAPARRQADGFQGAVLTFNDLVKDADPAALLQRFLTSATTGS